MSKRYSIEEVSNAWFDCGLGEQPLMKLIDRTIEGTTVEQLHQTWQKLEFVEELFNLFKDELEYKIEGRKWKYPSDK